MNTQPNSSNKEPIKEGSIERGNRLIADFMFDKNGEYWRVPNCFPFKYDTGWIEVGENFDFEFNVRWDWLMPVWKKIREVTKGVEQYSGFRELIGAHVRNVDIIAAFKTIVNFLEWHNRKTADAESDTSKAQSSEEPPQPK